MNADLFVAGLIVQALLNRLDTFDRENAHLRVKAQAAGCPYGMLGQNGACLMGYPGCACMDDLYWATSFPPATDQDAYQHRLERRSRALAERTRIAANSFRSMAEGFQKAREPSKAAACQGMADLMEHQL